MHMIRVNRIYPATFGGRDYAYAPLNANFATICHAKERKAAGRHEGEVGRQIVQTPGQIRQTHQNRWVVRSQTCGTPSYVVVLGIKDLVCDCVQGQLGRGLCKHVAAVDMWLSGKWATLRRPERMTMRRPAVRCPVHASHRPGPGRPPDNQTQGKGPEAPVQGLREALSRPSRTETLARVGRHDIRRAEPGLQGSVAGARSRRYR